MPYRSTFFLVALFGSVLVVALMLLGRDLRRAARTGPGWKRKLVAAGLVLLAAMGINAGCGDGTGLVGGSAVVGSGVDDPISKDQSLAETKQWKHLAEVWREADQIGSGKRGQYPFHEKGKKEILGELAAVGTNLDRFQETGLLTAAESGLLKQELSLLTSRVQAKRPTEMRNASCYEPMAFTPGRDSLKRLTDRLPLLEKLADAETIRPEVVSKVLATVEKDLATLRQEKTRDRLPDDLKAQAEKVSGAAAAHVEKIKSKLNGKVGALESHPKWQVVTGAWKTATPLAVSGKSTEAQRKAVDKKLESAKQGATELAEAGLISDAESKLLFSEAARLRQEIYRNPPTDCKVTCYDMAFIPPAQQSLKRLNQRLPLLKQLAAGGKVHPAALKKVLGSVEDDIRMLADEARLKQLAPQQRQQAGPLREEAEAAVAEIRKILG